LLKTDRNNNDCFDNLLRKKWKYEVKVNINEIDLIF